MYNIGTGRSISDESSDLLLNVDVLGERSKTNFIVSCSEKEDDFESRIPLNKILNFGSANIKQKVKNKNKVKEIRLQKDLF